MSIHRTNKGCSIRATGGDANAMFEALTGQRSHGEFCDGAGPHAGDELKVLPTGADSKAILCHACFNREMIFRRAQNAKGRNYAIVKYASLKDYAKGDA